MTFTTDQRLAGDLHLQVRLESSACSTCIKPAHSAAMIELCSRLSGAHVNDNYTKRNNGLLAGSVNPQQMVSGPEQQLINAYRAILSFTDNLHLPITKYTVT